VNPKQETVVNGYGNYVRLPYFGGWEKQPTERIVLDDDETPLDLGVFVLRAHAERVPPERIHEVAALWKPPVVVRMPTRAGAPMSLGELKYIISPYTYTILTNGPLEGSDRSSTLVRLAARLRQDGLMPAETLTMLIEADKKWGKYHDREDGITYLEQIVMRVFE
jgi:hypothetical protein